MTLSKKRCMADENFSERLKKQNRKKAQRPKLKARKERKAPNASEASDASENRRLDPVLKLKYPKAVLHRNYSCTLLHVDIAKKQNEFYVMQLVKLDKEFLYYTRSGKVGVQGKHNMEILTDINKAVRIFEETFTTKTKTAWVGRRYYQFFKDSYSLLDIDGKASDKDTSPTLHPRTKRLIRHICSDKLFIRMPLGTVGKKQVQKALHVLDEIEKAIKTEKSPSVLKSLSSKFFTFIPQEKELRELNISREVYSWRKKLSVFMGLDIYSDGLQERYEGLECDLTYLSSVSEEFKLIHQCAGVSRKGLTDVWKVDRKGEGQRFAAHGEISHRKLLWHGTRVPNVALILKQGLRILNRSGGSFGAGIYFASDFSKSVAYVHRENFEDEKHVGYMFLVEVALGKTFDKETTDYTLRRPPEGYDSLVARGRTEPDPKKDEVLTFDGKRVVFPCGSPVRQEEWASSELNASEYLIYKESLARLRYILKFSR